MAQADLSPATDKKLVALVLERGLVAKEALDKVVREPRKGSLARALCERGLLSREKARALLHEIRESRETIALPREEARAGAARAGVLEPGARFGSYRIEAELGRGGQGAVYRATDERLRREVALKLLLGQEDQEARERFLREARAAARIRHPGVVAVLGAELIEGIPVIALELVSGTSLAKKIEKEGPLAPHAAAALVRDVALAVAAAHEVGILHRDLKPGNVLLDESGRPRLTDFGLARDVNVTGMTETGVAMGTPAYMSPEQAQAGAVSPATDVYGLGAILYDCLAGRPPFQGPGGLAILKKVIEEEPERPSRLRVARGLAAVPLDLETVLMKALEKRPARRYASAEALAKDLDRFTRGEAVSARPPGALERALRYARKRPLVPALASLAVVMGMTAYFARADQVRREAIEQAKAEARAAGSSFAAMSQAYGPHLTLRDNKALELLASGTRASSLADRYVALANDDEAHVFACGVKEKLGELAFRGNEFGLSQLALREAEQLAPEKERKRLASLLERALGRSGKLMELSAIERMASSPDPADRPQSIELLDRLLSADPTWALLWSYRAHARLLTGDLDGAEADLEQGLRLDPSNLVMQWLHASVLLARGDNEGARVLAERAVELAPDLYEGYHYRALARARLGDLPGARADLEKFESLTEIRPPDMVELRKQLAQK